MTTTRLEFRAFWMEWAGAYDVNVKPHGGVHSVTSTIAEGEAPPPASAELRRDPVTDMVLLILDYPDGLSAQAELGVRRAVESHRLAVSVHKGAMDTTWEREKTRHRGRLDAVQLLEERAEELAADAEKCLQMSKVERSRTEGRLSRMSVQLGKGDQLKEALALPPRTTPRGGPRRPPPSV